MEKIIKFNPHNFFEKLYLSMTRCWKKEYIIPYGDGTDIVKYFNTRNWKIGNRIFVIDKLK